MSGRLEAIRAAIRERYRTAHAFCRAHPELTRATVYLALSGRYPGNLEKQAAKLEAALKAGTGEEAKAPCPATLTAREAYAVLQESKCAHCRRLDLDKRGRGCAECNTQTMREAEDLEAYLRGKP